MPTPALEFEIELGRTWEVYLSYQPGSVVANLSSNTTYIQARTEPSDTAALFDYNTTDDATEIEHVTTTFDGVVYNVHVKLSPTITAALTAGDCYVQVWTKDAADDVFEVLPETFLRISQPSLTIA